MSNLKSEYSKINFDGNFLNYIENEPTNMLEAKLWRNPCPFTFRINYLALLYNTQLYKWIFKKYNLNRPEYVVLFSLAISEGGSASEVSNTSGFPKNTLSRAISILEDRGLIKDRINSTTDGRKQSLFLSKPGWKVINETVPIFEKQENRMLYSLSKGEKQILFEILSKVVKGAKEWSKNLPSEKEIDKKDNKDANN